MAVCKHGRPSPAVCFDCDGPDDDTVSPLAPPRPIAHVIAKRGGGKCDECRRVVRVGQAIDMYDDGTWRHAWCRPT